MSNPIGQRSIDELNPQEKAQLLATVKAHKKERPLDWITVAEILQKTPSNQVLAKRLGVTARLIGMIKSLSSLPDEIKDYVKTRQITSLDIAMHIARLKRLSDQQFLAKAVVAEPRNFTSSIVQKSVVLKNRNESLSIAECVSRVLKSKPIKENRYILVTTVEKSLRENFSEKLAKQGVSFLELLKNTIKKSLPNDEALLSVAEHNGLILLTLTQDGWYALRQKSGSLGVPIDELVETLLKDTLETPLK